MTGQRELSKRCRGWQELNVKAQKDLNRKVIMFATGKKPNCDEAEASSVYISFKNCNDKRKARGKKVLW